MTVKKILATDMKDALKKAKELFGNDAIIISSQDTENGISVLVSDKELVADEVENILQNSNSGSSNMHSEISALKALLTEQFSNILWDKKKRLTPEHAVVIRRLTECGYCPKIVEEIVHCLPNENKDLWGAVETAILKQIKMLNRPLIDDNGVFCFWGGSGVGKTLTVLKIATQFTMCYSVDEILLASTDVSGIGKTDLIKTFGKITNIPVRVLASNNDINQLIRETRTKRLVLIDTNPIKISQSILQGLNTELLSIPDISHYFVASSNTQIESLYAQYKSIDSLNFKGGVITKTDEILSYGQVISFFIEAKIPLHYICNGSNVPDDLTLANNKIIKDSLHYQPEHNLILDESDIARIYSKVDLT